METTLHRRMLTLIVIAALGGGACSDSSAPTPSFLGTWHARVTSFSPDTLQPNPFTVTLAAAHGDTLTLTMAPVEWDHGPNYVFDSTFTVVIPSGGDITLVEKDVADNWYLGIQGTANAARDTIMGQIGVLDGTFHTLGVGTVVVTKH